MEQISKISYNRSAYFILPLLGIGFEYFNLGKLNAFINTYLYKKGEKEKRFYVVLDAKNLEFVDLKEDVVTNINFDKYVFTDNLLILCYKYSTEMKNVLNIIERGKYSTILETSKKTIIKYMRLKVITEEGERESPYYRAMFPNEESRKALEILLGSEIDSNAEILSPINKENETLKLN